MTVHDLAKKGWIDQYLIHFPGNGGVSEVGPSSASMYGFFHQFFGNYFGNYFGGA